MKKRTEPVKKSKSKSKVVISDCGKVKINCTAIEDNLNPIVDCETSLKVKVIVPGLNQHNVQEALINHRNVIVFDTGLTIDVPCGFRLNGKLISKFSSLGLLATDFNVDENKKLKITVINLGQVSPVIVKHMEVIAEIWFEPCYSIELGGA